MILPIDVGDTITIKEADRYLGYGDVTLRITELPPKHLPTGSDWIQVTGIEIAGNGQDVAERTTLIRAAALRPPT
jgi:hypothetical protein